MKKKQISTLIAYIHISNQPIMSNTTLFIHTNMFQEQVGLQHAYILEEFWGQRRQKEGRILTLFK